MINTITLLGSSSGRNAGDAALLSGIMDSIDSACGMKLLYEIPTIKPAFIRTSYENRVKAIPVMPWNLSLKLLGVTTYRSIMRTDLSLVFDAVLFDRSLFNPLFNHLGALALLLDHAKKRQKAMAYFNVSAGPVKTPLGRKLLRELSERMDFITVRDQASADLLHEIGVKNSNLVVTADAALNVRPSSEKRIGYIWKELGFESSEEVLAINISKYLDTWAVRSGPSIGKEEFIKIYSKALSKVAKELGVPLLFVCTQYHDVPVTQALMDSVEGAKQKALISNRDHSHHDISGVLAKVSLLCAMRLHAIILASAGLTPLIALPHQPKVNHYLDSIGLSNFSLSFDQFSSETLAQHLLNGWNERNNIKTILKGAIPRQQEKALFAAELVAAMHLSRPVAPLIESYRNNGKGQSQSINA